MGDRALNWDEERAWEPRRVHAGAYSTRIGRLEGKAPETFWHDGRFPAWPRLSRRHSRPDCCGMKQILLPWRLSERPDDAPHVLQSIQGGL